MENKVSMCLFCKIISGGNPSEKVFENVKAILESSGSSWDNLIDVTVFLTNMNDDFQKYNELYKEYFKDNRPCRTTVEINCLPTPIAIELKVIATID